MYCPFKGYQALENLVCFYILFKAAKSAVAKVMRHLAPVCTQEMWDTRLNIKLGLHRVAAETVLCCSFLMIREDRHQVKRENDSVPSSGFTHQLVLSKHVFVLFATQVRGNAGRVSMLNICLCCDVIMCNM